MSMDNLISFILGSLFSLWSGISTSKWFYFKDLRIKAVTTYAEITVTDEIRKFFDNARSPTAKFFPIVIALKMAGHDKAAAEVEAVIKEVNAELGKLILKPTDQFSGHLPKTAFQLDAWTILAKRTDLIERLENVQPSRGVLLEPHW
jgi:hypothetical protein